jgi:NADH:ubiquinone oxidoreductase subunit 6 (subunit J)
MYEWTHLNDRIIQHRQPYLSIEWWIFRAVLYFVWWGVMVYLLNKWSWQQDQSDNYEDSAKFLADASKFSGPTMVFFVLVVSFAAIDWVMTLDPHWYSTMWGFLFVAGWALSCFCFMVAIMAALADKPPMNRVLGKRHFHDIGKLMLALVMVWAYFNFSQYLIIWSGNLPEETNWYLTRQEGAWGAIGAILIILHFAFPFLVLLSRDIKRNARWLAYLAFFILLLRLVDMYYMIGPSPRIGMHGQEVPFALSFSWMDIVAPIAVGGIWLWWFFGKLMKRPLVPVNDPFLENAIEHGKH